MVSVCCTYDTHTHTHACAYMQRNVWLSHQVTSTTDYAGLLADLSGQVGFPTKSLCLDPMNLSDSGFKVSLDAFSSKRRATKVLFSWCWLRDVEGCRGTKGIDIGHHKLIIVDIHSERCWEAKQLSCWAAKSWLGGITLEKRFPVVTFLEFLPKPLTCEATPADWKQVSCGNDVNVWGPGVLYGQPMIHSSSWWISIFHADMSRHVWLRSGLSFLCPRRRCEWIDR